MANTPPEPGLGGRNPREPWVLAAVLVFALCLRVAFAAHKGLVLDEFHTLFHASRPSWSSFLETLLQDNHPPLAFLCVRGARALLGESELALRSPAIVCGLIEIATVWVAGRRLFGAGVASLAASLLAASSLHLDFSTQARMYAELSLAVTLVLAIGCDAIARPEARGRSTLVVLAIACSIGLHAHYFFLEYAAILGAVAVVLIARGRAHLARPAAFGVAALAAVLLAAPWYATGFRAQLAHGLSPGGHSIGASALAESFVHLFFLNLRLAGALRPVFVAAAAMLLVLAGLGLTETWRAGGRFRSLAVWLGAGAFGVPLVATLLAQVWPRAGFTWHYVLPSAAPMALLAARGACGRTWRVPRLAAASFALLAAVVLSFLNLSSPGSEDYPGAVRAILADWRPGDVVIAAEWQPGFFSQGAPWDYYAPRLAEPGLAPRRLEIGPDHDLLAPAELGDARKVFLLATSLGPRSKLLQRLRSRYGEESARDFGYGIVVRMFEAPRDGG